MSLIITDHAQQCFAIPPWQHLVSAAVVTTGASGEEEQPVLIVHSRNITDGLNSSTCWVPSICPLRRCFLIRGSWFSFPQAMLNSSKSWQPALWRMLLINFHPEFCGRNQTPRTTHIPSGMSDKLPTHKTKDNSFTVQQRMFTLHCIRQMDRLLFTQNCPVRARQISPQHGTTTTTKKTFFSCQGGQTLKLGTQRGSTLENIQTYLGKEL